MSSLVRRQFSFIVIFILAAGTPSVYAQTNAGAQKLSTLIENVFGPRGLIVDSEVYVLDGTTHSAHFNSAFQSDIRVYDKVERADWPGNVRIPR